jgi:hypothetical protein
MLTEERDRSACKIQLSSASPIFLTPAGHAKFQKRSSANSKKLGKISQLYPPNEIDSMLDAFCPALE